MTAWRREGADLLLAVRLTPGARQERIGGAWADARGDIWLQASVTAAADRGRANAALVRLLARRIEVPASSISLEAGATNRLKRLRLSGCRRDTERAVAALIGEERAEP